MNFLRRMLAATLLGALCACGMLPGPSQTTAPPVATATPPGVESLPCAVVSGGEDLEIGYPAESLYLGGAVLPKGEGLACLEVLADWLKRAPQARWQIVVRGEAGHGVEPLALADRRMELLKRFFARQAVATEAWQWQAEAGPGAQLELRRLKGAP